LPHVRRARCARPRRPPAWRARLRYFPFKDPFMTRFAPAAALLATLVLLQPALAQTKKGDADDPVVATVDGAPIYRSDVVAVQRTLPAQFQQLPIEVLFPAVVERLIDTKLVVNAGRKENLQNDGEVKRRVAGLEDRVIQEIYLTRKVEAAVTDKAVQERYEQLAKSTPAKEEVKASHILVQTEQEAKTVIADLKKGGNFAEIAKTKSIDPSGKQNGGDLGFFGREEMVPEFSEAAFKLKDGETTEAPVKSQFGWHVIRVEAHRSQAPSLDEMREQIANDLQQEVVTGMVAKMREGAKVERFGLDGQALPTPAPKQ
jgi:peptidyl-prolyl cis-trans isomerase C